MDIASALSENRLPQHTSTSVVYLDFPYEKPAKTGALLCIRASRRAQGGVFTGEAHATMFWDTKCFDSMENSCQPMENGILMVF